jgi:DNA-binding NtrC family response regulator
MRVGSTVIQDSDVRVIAATNRPPEQAMASGKLREDLYYRLNVFPIILPPLHERSEDIALLAEHFLAAVCEKEGHGKTLSPAALARLAAYRWPGNVRELRNVVQRAYVMAPGDVITDEWLPTDGPAAALTLPQRATSAGNGTSTPTPPGNTEVPSITIPIGTSMADAECLLILATLQHFNNQKERTAAVLGVSLKTLYNRLKDYAGASGEFKPEEPLPSE